MALVMNLAALPLKFAIPVMAGLAAGTGGVAAYVTAPATAVAARPSTSPAPLATEQGQAAPAKPNTKPSCERETWPYIDNRCMTRRGNEPERTVRLVLAPRAGEAAPPAAAANLVTSDTVLRGPGVAPEVNDQPAARKPAKRSETRRQRNRDDFSRVYSVYSVPPGEGARPVIVVRPLRLGADSPRF
jgi:hypothetical protein